MIYKTPSREPISESLEFQKVKKGKGGIKFIRTYRPGERIGNPSA